jgi:hypothetical protein
LKVKLGGLEVSEAQRLLQLAGEIARLKRLRHETVTSSQASTERARIQRITIELRRLQRRKIAA